MTDNTRSFPSGSASKRAAIVAAIVVVMTPGVSLGQPSFQMIKQFVESPKQVVTSLIEGDDGGLYAPAQGGGAFGKGAILQFDRHADGTLTFTTLHSFNGADGVRNVSTTMAESGGFEWIFNDAQTECVVRETYKDSGAVLEHIANLGESLGAILAVSNTALEIYRSPSSELVKAAAGLAPKIYSPFQST